MRVDYVERVAGRSHTHTRERSELGLPLPPFLTTVEQHTGVCIATHTLLLSAVHRGVLYTHTLSTAVGHVHHCLA